MNITHAAYLLTLPLAELKSIKRAVNILVRVGMLRDDATELVITKHQDRHHAYREMPTRIAR